MSVITDMIIVTNNYEREAIERLNAWCRDNDTRQQEFQQLDADVAGGWRVFTGEVWAMSGNHFPWSDLSAKFSTFGWRIPKEVVLIVNHEFEEETHTFRGDML